MIECLEPRRLLSNYSFSVLSDLDSTVGFQTLTAPVLDGSGNLFDLTHQGGSGHGGTIFELPVGQHTPTLLSTTVLPVQSAPSGNVVIDSAGNLYSGASSPGGSGIGVLHPDGSSGDFFNFTSPMTQGAVVFGGLIIKQPALVLSGMPVGMNFFGATDSGGLNGEGTIFEISDISTPTEIVYVPFPTNRPALGNSLTLDAAGDLYGTYPSGGSDGDGQIFEAPAGGGVLLTPASFDGDNGMNPTGPMLYDAASGDFYGTTESGGANGQGTIYKFNGTSITALASFGGTDGTFSTSSLYEDSAGDLFGTATSGGANFEGTVFELPAGSSTIKNLVNFDGSDNGGDPQGGLVADSKGNLFGVTSNGGAFDDGVIYELSPLPASQLNFDSQPQSALTGQTLAPITVDTEDSDGGIVNTNTSAVTLSLTTPDGATLQGTLTQNAVAGVATFSNLSLTTPGTYTLTATDGSLADATSTSFKISLPPSQLQFAAQPQAAQTDQTLGTVTVDVDDADGNIFAAGNSTVTLALTAPPAGAVLGGVLSMSAVNGVATFTGLSVNTAGNYTLTATNGSLAAATSTLFKIILPPSQLQFAAQPQPAQTDQTLGIITVDVEDADGNIVAPDNSSVTLALTNPPAGVVLSGAFTASAVSGVATFTGLSVNTAGTFTLTATDGSLKAAASNSFAISFPPPHVAFAARIANGTSGVKLAPVTIDLIDADNTIETTIKPAKVTITTTDPKGKLLRFTAQSKKGVATFKGLSFKTAGTYSLSAAAAAFATESSNAFAIAPAVAKKILLTIAPVSVAAAAPFQVQAELFDAFGNLATNDDSTATIGFAGNPRDAILAGLTSATVTNGRATFSNLSITPAAKAYALKIVDGKLRVTSKRFAVR